MEHLHRTSSRKNVALLEDKTVELNANLTILNFTCSATGVQRWFLIASSKQKSNFQFLDLVTFFIFTKCAL